MCHMREVALLLVSLELSDSGQPIELTKRRTEDNATLPPAISNCYLGCIGYRQGRQETKMKLSDRKWIRPHGIYECIFGGRMR